MQEGKYVAYIGTYTNGDGKGIYIYDMDVEKGTMEYRKAVSVNNASYMAVSSNGKFLYSIADEGVKAFRIMEDGDLEELNTAPIRGMRGCYLSTDAENRFLFVAGYHDGKVTVLRLKEDGSVGEITDEVFHKGLGSVSERSFRPHVNCVKMTPDQKYLCAVDLGVDHVKIYSFNHNTGKLRLTDFLRCELESAPRHLIFSDDGKYAYLICELKNIIYVYAYDGSGRSPEFELLQTVSTLEGVRKEANNAASAVKLSADGKYLFCSNAGKNTVGIFKIDVKTGMLSLMCNLPISGDYPKDIGIFPDGKHFAALNHETNEITLFAIDYGNSYIYRHTKPLSIEKANCIIILDVNE